MFPPIRAARALPYLKCLPSYRAVQHVAFTVFVVMAALAVTAPAAEALTFTVNNTGDIDDGGTLATGACQGADFDCTLREAIRLANENVGISDEIHFNIPITDLGCLAQPWCVITLVSSLPSLVDDYTTIDGFTQDDTNSGTVGSGLVPGVPTSVAEANPCDPLVFEKPDIAINASQANPALNIAGGASHILIQGLAIYNAVTALRGSAGAGTDRVVEFMFIGVLPTDDDPDTLLINEQDPGPLRNTQFGVQQSSPSAFHGLEVRWSMVGFNGLGGIDSARSASSMFVWQNDVFENGSLSNLPDGPGSHDGIDLNGINSVARCNLSRDNRVPLVVGVANGGGGNGIELGSKDTPLTLDTLDNNLVEYNTVTNNASTGISIRQGPIGSIVRKNEVFLNPVGISVNREGTVARRHQLSQNSIYQNEGLGIDLEVVQSASTWEGSPDGITPNDELECDADEGSNDLQNYPNLTSATAFNGSTKIDGTLISTPDTTFTIEFFATPDDDLFGLTDREGRFFIGSIQVTTDGCTAAFSATFGTHVPEDQVVTATATKFTVVGVPWSTSEFSGPITVNQVDLSAKVTGGGWYFQPNGATPAPQSDADRATTGFNAKYLAHFGLTPQGVTNFNYRSGATKIHFISTSYEELSLLVSDEGAGKRAEWRGKGKLNNKPGYCFRVRLHDEGQGTSTQSTEEDRYRIKIWSPGLDGTCSTQGAVIYDNDPTDFGIVIKGGNFVVHMQPNS